MSEIPTSVEISKDNPKYLLIDGVEGYEISEQRTITKDNIPRYLIEEQSQIDERITTGDFKFCIFLGGTCFEDKEFKEPANFNSTIFSGATNFRFATFNQNVDFDSAIFIQDANFDSVTFTRGASFHSATFIKEVLFDSATFAKYANFDSTTFTKKANFLYVTFTQQAHFERAKFTQDANFTLATFVQNAVFNFATFGNIVDFQSAEFNTVLSLYKVTVKLDLNNTIVDRIECNDANFIVDNRETFLTLKSVALKQNDRIKALEFHQQEYQTYFKDLKWKQFDKWILGFEYWVSDFGASTIRAIMRLIGIILFFYLLINGFHYDTKVIVDFISPLSYDIDAIFCNIDRLDRWLFFVYKILQVILIYEIIKSFRKFSRKL